MTSVFIRGMMCVRCKTAVKTVLDQLGIHYHQIELGKVDLFEPLSADKFVKLDAGLREIELELIVNRKRILTEQIKTAIILLFAATRPDLPPRFSEYLSKKLFYTYTHLSNVFSEMENSSVERFYIETRLRKAKDLLMTENGSINSIAADLGFNSAAHFCIQFKKLTGSSPGSFRKEVFQQGQSCKSVDALINAHDHK